MGSFSIIQCSVAPEKPTETIYSLNECSLSDNQTSGCTLLQAVREQRLRAAQHLSALAVSSGGMTPHTLLSRTLEEIRVFLPAELVGCVECILDAALVQEAGLQATSKNETTT